MKCGDFGGTTAHGNPCERTAGWGRDAYSGRCLYHAEQGVRPAREGDGKNVPSPPADLSDQAQATWRAIVGDWVLSAEELLILQGGLEAWDLYRGARAQLRREGPVFTTESGTKKRHPAALVARDALRDFRDAIRQLGLESLAPEGD